MEPQGDRREKARAIGARIADTNEDGFDLSFELSGTDGGRAAALSRVKRDGVVTLLASTSGNLPVDVMEIVRRRLTVRGALIYDHPADFQDSLRELCGAGASLDSASGYAFRIEECNTAFSSAIRNPGKAIVTMNQDNGYGLQKGE
jgi:alcohol dehydrogenase/L-iditol 2-dehydrogenase